MNAQILEPVYHQMGPGIKSYQDVTYMTEGNGGAVIDPLDPNGIMSSVQDPGYSHPHHTSDWGYASTDNINHATVIDSDYYYYTDIHGNPDSEAQIIATNMDTASFPHPSSMQLLNMDSYPVASSYPAEMGTSEPGVVPTAGGAYMGYEEDYFTGWEMPASMSDQDNEQMMLAETNNNHQQHYTEVSNSEYYYESIDPTTTKPCPEPGTTLCDMEDLAVGSPESSYSNGSSSMDSNSLQSSGATAVSTEENMLKDKHRVIRKLPGRKMHQRHAANVRERRRMRTINDAFEHLRQRVPTAQDDKKTSKVDTLKMAVSYISTLTDVLKSCGETNFPGLRKGRGNRKVVVSYNIPELNPVTGEYSYGHSLSWEDLRDPPRTPDNRFISRLWVPRLPTQDDLKSIEAVPR